MIFYVSLFLVFGRLDLSYWVQYKNEINAPGEMELSLIPVIDQKVATFYAYLCILWVGLSLRLCNL